MPTEFFSRYAVRLLPLEEQRRIAEILDTIDETIQATERVIAKARHRFNRTRVRQASLVECGKWEDCRRLGEQMTIAYSGGKPVYQPDSTPFYSVLNAVSAT